nr:lipoprotein [Amycolatopsis decaplanina]
MFSKRLVSVAALMTAGALALAACGSPASAPSPAAPAQTEAGDGAPALLVGTAKANDTQPKTGDWATGSDGTPNTAEQTTARKWVQLMASEAGELNPVVVNGAGLTLYRFDKDTAKPSKSTCDGECAKTWPPVLVTGGSKIFLAGVKKSAVGTVERSDGTRQVTIAGWPVYRFAKDTEPGDTKGQGVGGTWFGVTPNGQKAGQDGSVTVPTTTTPSSEEQRPATSAVLFDGRNFSDNESSQGVAGNGCKNVTRPGVASSIAASGSVKIWSEKDCKGKSLSIDGDVADLAKVGFDNAVASVFFG